MAELGKLSYIPQLYTARHKKIYWDKRAQLIKSWQLKQLLTSSLRTATELEDLVEL
jgi:hypothetical protein